MAVQLYDVNTTARNVVSFDLFRMMHRTYELCIEIMSDLRNYNFPTNLPMQDRMQLKGGVLSRFYTNIAIIKSGFTSMLPAYFNVTEQNIHLPTNFNYVPYDVMRVALAGVTFRIAEAIMDACKPEIIGHQHRLQLRLFHQRNLLDNQFQHYLTLLRTSGMLGITNADNVNAFIQNRTEHLDEPTRNRALNGDPE